MKAVTSDRLGLETVRQAPALSTLHGCCGGCLICRQVPCCPPGPAVQSAQQIVSDGLGVGQHDQGLGPTDQSTAGLQRACL